ncbi:hypothetical protein SAMN06269250_0344 [Spirosoma fluviale]|uniref:Uncharacterized protein n=1 Tax=Spirosoma fluviale TaxID=1597977 RepID=A0A286F4U6_9BACT|nr:hypothetical protein SAMN06269250_0344 [Spirosoma fluviale]
MCYEGVSYGIQALVLLKIRHRATQRLTRKKLVDLSAV